MLPYHEIEPLRIRTVQSGIYEGFSPAVSMSAKVLIAVLVTFLVLFPEASGTILASLKDFTLRKFANWYVYLMAAFVLVCVWLVLSPAGGRIRLGRPGEEPEYSTISWLSMMFCSGIGVGILVFSVSEPMSHFITNPNVMQNEVSGQSIENVSLAFQYTFLHWGFSPWASYAIIAIALGLSCHRSEHPLTMRSAVTCLFGKRLEGPLGHAIDVIAILAIMAGMTTTIVLGIEQICAGLSILTGNPWFADNYGNPSLIALLSALVVAISIAMGSLVSGVDRGVKWIANLGVALTFFVLGVFLVFGPSDFVLKQMGSSIIQYVSAFPSLIFTTRNDLSSETGQMLNAWQGDWTIFYWAWWIAFAPFVGLFLARISKGRTIREFILGSVIAPTTICILWFSVVGGSAIGLELGGEAKGAIVGAGHALRIYETIQLMLPGTMGIIIKGLLVFLFLVLIVASSSAAILAIKAIGAGGGSDSESTLHSLIWAIFIAAITGSTIAVGGVSSIRDAMIVGALPFSLIMAFMIVSVVSGVRGALKQASKNITDAHISTIASGSLGRILP